MTSFGSRCGSSCTKQTICQDDFANIEDSGVRSSSGKIDAVSDSGADIVANWDQVVPLVGHSSLLPLGYNGLHCMSSFAEEATAGLQSVGTWFPEKISVYKFGQTLFVY